MMEETFMRHCCPEKGKATDREWTDRDNHDKDVLALDSVLDESALQQWDRAREGDVPPQSLVSETTQLEDADASFHFHDGTAMFCADCRDDDADSCESGLTGSSDREEWELRHDDFGDVSDYEDDSY